MNLIVGAPWWLVAFLMVALLSAAIEDAVRLRISNITCVAVAMAAFASAGIQGFSLALWQNALVFIAILAIGTPMFAAGWLGGGDVKLLAAIGSWLNLSAATSMMAAVFLAGGVLAFAYIAVRLATRPRRKSDREGKGRVPYGLAIVAGASFAFAMQLSHRPSSPFIDRMRATESKPSPPDLRQMRLIFAFRGLFETKM